LYVLILNKKRIAVFFGKGLLKNVVWEKAL